MQKYNTTASQQLEDKALSDGTDDGALIALQNELVRSFAQESAVISLKYPQVYDKILAELMVALTFSRSFIVQQISTIKETFDARISEVVKPPMSEAEIFEAGENLSNEMLGGSSNPHYAEIFKRAIQLILRMHVEVCCTP